MFVWRNKKNINNFQLKKAPYLELWSQRIPDLPAVSQTKYLDTIESLQQPLVDTDLTALMGLGFWQGLQDGM